MGETDIYVVKYVVLQQTEFLGKKFVGLNKNTESFQNAPKHAKMHVFGLGLKQIRAKITGFIQRAYP